VNPKTDFYDIQQRQRRKSLLLFVVLILFYFFINGLASSVSVGSFALIFAREGFFSASFILKFLLINAAVSLCSASFHFYDAKKNGARYILKRLRARHPDLSDRYHKQFANTVEEIRIAAGLPKVTPYIIPDFAINSLALIHPDKIPIVIVTEGLLAEFTRNELQAVVAHELAHIIRGDTVYITLVCSLANIFERIRFALESKKLVKPGIYETEGYKSGFSLMYVFAVISSSIMHLLSTLISREREILADAAAVELSRDPGALARAIYRAHVKNSFVGDFPPPYTPLFIVPPESRGNGDGFLSRIFNSHPPLMKRISLLAGMINKKPAEIISEVWEIQRDRESFRRVIPSHEEAVKGRTFEAHEPGILPEPEEKVWSVKDPKGNWRGPFSIEELLFLRFFTPLIRISNIHEGIEAQAREFPQIRQALRNVGRRKPINKAKQNLCPRCRAALRESYYEGVAIKTCKLCQGKLVDSGVMERILTRKEVAFSEQLKEKAKAFKDNFMLNPVRMKKIRSGKHPAVFCPNCGCKMLPRPYTYQYIIPVDKCFCCYKIWFDADELEILQVLTEK